MSLKKSDKIIAVIGVLILVIAGAAIVIYAMNYEETEETTEPAKTTYMVVWKENRGEMKLPDKFVEKGETPFTEAFTVNAESGSVLTSVVIRVEWNDDTVYKGLLGRILPSFIKGKDDLTVKIACEGGDTKTHEGTGGSGSENLTFSINSIPLADEVEAMTAEEAIQNITEDYSEMDSADFNIEASVAIGEKLLKNRDEGNAFSLYITYTYYYPEIENPE